MVFRYSQWNGTQTIPSLDPEELLDLLGRDLLEDGDLRRALERLLMRGANRSDRSRMPGMRDLLERLRQRREEQLSRYNLGSMLDGLSAVQSIQGSTYTGSAGGGLVRIVANGRMEVESVTISPEAFGDEPDTELVADLVLAALRDLTNQIAEAQKQAMGPLGSILGQ